MNQIVGLGWRSDLEPRDELYGTATPFLMLAPFTAPAEIDHRSWMTVENQRVMGSCSGQAISSIQEVLNYIATGGGVIQLSRMFGYLAGQKFDGIRGDQGATITSSIRGAKELGCCPESMFPYPCPSNCTCQRSCAKYSQSVPAEASAEAKLHLVTKHSVLRSYTDCFTYLASGVGGVEIGIPWDDACAKCTGVLDKTGGQVYGGHALAVVGYSPRKDSQGRQYLWMLNSHGKGWAKQGWGEVAPALFDKWGRDPQSELIGVTDLQAFTPRIVDFRGMSG